MSYRLHGRLTQEQWFEKQRNGEMTDEEIAQRTCSYSLGWSDLIFLHGIHALDWSWAGSLIFQHFIDLHGTVYEKLRLDSLNCGYRDIDLSRFDLN